jgi:hypothetical protein
MYAMIRRYADPGCATDDIVRAGRQLAAVLDHVPGFVSLVIVQGSGGLAVVSLFEEQANLQAVEQHPGACLAEHLPGVVKPVDLTTGQVVFQRGL